MSRKLYRDATGLYYANDTIGEYLSEGDIKFNAKCIVKYFKELRQYSNWSDNAICGLFGNMERESHINPRCTGSNGAYGLIQWDPKSAMIRLLKKINEADTYKTMFSQCKGIDYDSKRNYTGKWISSGSYVPSRYQGVTFQEWAESNESVEWCTECFMYCYEKPGVPALEERLQWANWLKDSGLLPGGSSSIDGFIAWLLNIANDNEYTYSQEYNHWNPPRWDSYLEYKYFDCSSFISYGLYNGGGYNIPRVFTTRTQKDELVEFGFNAIPYKRKSQLRKGDILLREGHTEAVSSVEGDTIKLVGAHQHYPTHPADDISERLFYNDNWETIIRPFDSGGGGGGDKKLKRRGMTFIYPKRW